MCWQKIKLEVENEGKSGEEKHNHKSPHPMDTLVKNFMELYGRKLPILLQWTSNIQKQDSTIGMCMII